MSQYLPNLFILFLCLSPISMLQGNCCFWQKFHISKLTGWDGSLSLNMRNIDMRGTERGSFALGNIWLTRMLLDSNIVSLPQLLSNNGWHTVSHLSVYIYWQGPTMAYLNFNHHLKSKLMGKIISKSKYVFAHYALLPVAYRSFTRPVVLCGTPVTTTVTYIWM